MDKKDKKNMDKWVDDTSALNFLGGKTEHKYENPKSGMLEAFPNKYEGRNYIINFDYPEFTSLCPKTGQPDFGLINISYVPNKLCVESKSFKLYMGAYRNHGSFMESLTNKIADDLIKVLAPRRLSVEGRFNVRGGTAISIFVDHLDESLSSKEKEELQRLW